MFVRPLLLSCLLVLPVAASAGETLVKISLSAEDPDIRTGEHVTGDPVEFHVWVEGNSLRGGEFGLSIDGAEFVSFAPPPEGGWMQLPIPNGPPGTIAQVVAGDCRPAPLLFGTLTVKPEKPGAAVVVDVTPSLYSNFALVLLCDTSPLNGLRAFPGAVNVSAEDLKSHRVEAEEASGGAAPGVDASGPEASPQAEKAPGAEAGG